MKPVLIEKENKWYIETEKGLLNQSFYTLQEAIEFIRGRKIPVSVWR